MSISFNQLPANWRLPLAWIEVDPSQAGTVTLDQPAILFGQKLAAGSATPDLPIAIGSLAQAKAAFGEGSMLERMFAAFYANNAAALLYAMPVVEPAAGVAATGSIEIATAPTAAGVLTIYIAGQRVQIAVAADDTAVEVVAALAAAINAKTTLPVTAAQGSAPNDDTVNLTCRWKGATGNDIIIAPNYGGSLAGEAFPTGLTLAVTAMASGAGAPSLTSAIAALGDDPYDFVGFPWTDSTSLGAIETEYGFGDTGRWGWMRQAYGAVFSARRDAYASQLAWGQSGNSPVSTILDVEPDSPTPVWEWAAAYTAKAARALLNDPARPLQTLELAGVLPAPRGKRRSKTEANNLAGAGIATQAVAANGQPAILAETSRYQKNVYSQGDTAYEHVTTLYTLAAVFRRLRQAATSKYPRHKLANDGTRFGPGQAIVTPNVIKAELIAEYRALEFDGLAENAAAFKANLIVERNAANPNRLDVLYPPDLVNQLRVLAVLAQFRLNYSTIDQAAA